jgi:hypothetical protein
VKRIKIATVGRYYKNSSGKGRIRPLPLDGGAVGEKGEIATKVATTKTLAGRVGCDCKSLDGDPRLTKKQPMMWIVFLRRGGWDSNPRLSLAPALT